MLRMRLKKKPHLYFLRNNQQFLVKKISKDTETLKSEARVTKIQKESQNILLL
jgi:hypothetical protein